MHPSSNGSLLPPLFILLLLFLFLPYFTTAAPYSCVSADGSNCPPTSAPPPAVCSGLHASSPSCAAARKSSPHFQSARVPVGSSRSRSKSVFIMFRQPFASAPRVICSPILPPHSAEQPHSEAFAVTVREALPHGFTLNVMTLHGTWWALDLQINYAAWTTQAVNPPGVRLGTASPLNFTRPGPTLFANYPGTSITLRINETVDEDAIVLLTPRISGSLDTQAVFATTLYSAATGNTLVTLARVDQRWPHECVAVDYIIATSALAQRLTSSCPFCNNVPVQQVMDPVVFPSSLFGFSSVAPAHLPKLLEAEGAAAHLQQRVTLPFDFKTVSISRQAFTWLRPPMLLLHISCQQTSDVVAVTIQEVTTTNFTLVLARVDRASGWQNALTLHWLAWMEYEDDVVALAPSVAAATVLVDQMPKFFKFRIEDALQDVLVVAAPSLDADAASAAACAVQQLLVSTSMTQPTSMFPDVIMWSATRSGSFPLQGLGVLPLSSNTSRLQLTIFHTDPAFKLGYFYLGVTGACSHASVSLYHLPRILTTSPHQRYAVTVTVGGAPVMFRLPPAEVTSLLQFTAHVTAIVNSTGHTVPLPDAAAAAAVVVVSNGLSADFTHGMTAANVTQVLAAAAAAAGVSSSSSDAGATAVRLVSLTPSGTAMLFCSLAAAAVHGVTSLSDVVTFTFSHVALADDTPLLARFHPQVQSNEWFYVQPLQRTLAKACVSFGHGLSLALLHTLSTFSIRAKDRFGNHVTSGGDSFTVVLTGPLDDGPAYSTASTVASYNINVTRHLPVVDSRDGMYHVEYTVTVIGRYSIDVLLTSSAAQWQNVPFNETLARIWASPFAVTGGGQFNVVSSTSATHPVASSASITAGRHASFRVPYNARFQVLTIIVHASRPVDVVMSNNSVYPTVTNTSSFFFKSDHVLACPESSTNCTHIITHRYESYIDNSNFNLFIGVYARFGDTLVNVSAKPDVRASVGDFSRNVFRLLSVASHCSSDLQCGISPAAAQVVYSNASVLGAPGVRACLASLCQEPAVFRFFFAEIRYGVAIRLHLGAWGGGGMFDAAAWASTGLQYTAAGSMAQTNLTNVTSAHVDLLLNNGLSVVGEIYVVAAAVSAAASPSSLAITASVVEGDVDSGAQRDSASKTFKQPPRLGRAAVAAAAATALPMARNVSVFVAKGAYSYWSLDVTPGFELRCSLQVSAGGAYVALLAASAQLPVATNPLSFSWSVDVGDAAAASLFVAQSDGRYRSGPYTLAAHAVSSGNASVYCWLTNAAAPVINVGQVVGASLLPSSSRLYRFVPDGTYSTYYVSCSVTAACSAITLYTQHALPPSPSSSLASSSSFTALRLSLPAFGPPHNTSTTHPIIGDTYYIHIANAGTSACDFSMRLDTTT